MNEGGEIVGMVDVLKLTYATLEQVCLLVTGLMQTFWLICSDQHYVNPR